MNNTNVVSKRTSSYEVKVADRIRLRRQQRNISQSELAESIGISFQQFQKNEMGRNRISVGRLVEIARILGTTPHDLLLWDNNAEQNNFEKRISRNLLDTQINSLWDKLQSKRFRKAIMLLLKIMIEEINIQPKGDKNN
jgi:transcriptional regulator with XRE-family HTH domain